jgi:subtilisin family serine protease
VFVGFARAAEALYYAAGRTANGLGTWNAADVINLSWGTTGMTTNAAFDAAVAWAINTAKAGKGVPIFAASGNAAAGTDAANHLIYETRFINVPVGDWQFEWQYAKDGSINAGEDRAWLANVRLPNDTTQRFDTLGIPSGWSTSGNADWSVVDEPARSYGTGRYVARSGAITHNQSSNFRSPTVTVPTGGGLLAYSVWVSSELSFDGLHLWASQNGGTFFEVDQFQDPNFPNVFFTGVPSVTSLASYPANLTNTISVGAGTDWDYRAAYSQYASTGNMNTLDFVAPSNGGYGAVATTDRTGADGYNQNGSGNFSDLAYTDDFGGTSAAAPLAAGIAALMLAKNPSLTAGQIRSIMRATADKVGGNIGQTAYNVTTGYNQYYGFGRVNAYAALQATPWPGDYSNNGTVDAADYVVWGDWLGLSVVMSNDITPGTVTQPDYSVWTANFGNSSTTQGSGSGFVPGDYNLDGIVGADDFDIWQANVGSTTNLDADGDFNGVVEFGDYLVWREMRGVTTSDDPIPGDFNSDFIVDMGDYGLWSDQQEYETWHDQFGTVHAGVFPLTMMSNGTDVPKKIAHEAPRVTGIRMSGSNSTHAEYDFDSVVGFGEQLRTVPVGGLDTVSISFSEMAMVLPEYLTLYGLNSQTTPTLNDFSYDVQTQTATWQFDSPFVKDQYLIKLSDAVFDLDRDLLDGEFVNPWSLSEPNGNASTFPSGDGEAGGEFRFRFTDLAGDFSQDNLVNSSDYAIWNNGDGNFSGDAEHGDGDADGDGYVDSADHAIWLSQSSTDYTRWPSVEPGMILVSTAADEDDANYVYGDLSLREALEIAGTNAGRDVIVFEPSISQILLTLGELYVDSDVEIFGPGADLLAIDAQGDSRVFLVFSGVEAAISGVTITGGFVPAPYDGGGVYTFGDLTLHSVVVSDNEAGDWGGGIYVATSGSLRLLNSTVDSNTATWGSGVSGHFGDGERLYVSGSTISNNSATGNGGGVTFWGTAAGSTGTIVNATVSGNSASHSGGIRAANAGQLTIINSTITDNHAADQGGGIARVGWSYLTLQNSIVAGNTASNGFPDIVSWNSGEVTANSSHNLIGDVGNSGLSTSTNIVIGASGNPGLAPLSNYGGPTKTHALLDGSPAIDSGDDALSLALDLFFDQRRKNRYADGDGDTLAAVDIGAFELAADEYFGSV